MRRLCLLMLISTFIVLFIFQTDCFSYQLRQEMKVVNLIGDKIAADKGSTSGIRENTIFDIARIETGGRKVIGQAQIIAIKENVCALKIIKLNRREKVQVGDILIEQVTEKADVYTPPRVATNKGRFGIRGGVGTDVNGGIAYGAVINYLFPMIPNPLEVGLAYYGGTFEETTEDFHTYVETTEIEVIGILANYLINYQQNGIFFLLGVGIGNIDVYWEEKSDTDSSLGPPLPGGGSKQDAEGSAVGFITNFGIGHKFSDQVDIRGEVPIFIISSAPGEASSVAPTFTVTLGIRF